MAYKIHYSSKKATKHTIFPRKILLTLGFFALFLCCARYFAADAILALWQGIMPSESLDVLLELLRNGEDFAEALSAFCEDMLYGR